MKKESELDFLKEVKGTLDEIWIKSKEEKVMDLALNLSNKCRDRIRKIEVIPQCNGCGRESRTVKSCGKDSNGDPDAPDLCFVCQKESERGKIYDKKVGKYVKWNQ